MFLGSEILLDHGKVPPELNLSLSEEIKSKRIQYKKWRMLLFGFLEDCLTLNLKYQEGFDLVLYH